MIHFENNLLSTNCETGIDATWCGPTAYSYSPRHSRGIFVRWKLVDVKLVKDFRCLIMFCPDCSRRNINILITLIMRNSFIWFLQGVTTVNVCLGYHKLILLLPVASNCLRTSSLSIFISERMFIRASLVSLLSVIVLRKHVLRRLNVLNERSTEAVDTGIVSRTFSTQWTFG